MAAGRENLRRGSREEKISVHCLPMTDPHIFRAYDIRGKADSQLTEEVCTLVGQGFGSVLRELYNTDHPKVIVGRDARTHSPKFEKALVEGLKSTGCDVFLIGQTPSPMNYFTLCQGQYNGSVQITASHNPPEDNGIKLQLRNAEAYAGDDLQILLKRIEKKDFTSGEGSVKDIDAVHPYVDHLSQLFKNAGAGMTVVIDGGNGVAGPVYCDVLKNVGAKLIELYIEPDGTFPNHAADPSKHDTLEELQAVTKKKKVTVGFAFDGDGDRIGIVDENGKILSADEILLLLAKDHLKRNPGAPVIFTVSNSGMLETEIQKWGGRPIMCKVGHSFVEHAMRKNKSLLGGEQSGHFFSGEKYFTFDDALVAGLRILKILQDAKKPLSELVAEFPKVYQSPEMRPYCPDEMKGKIITDAIKIFQKDFPVETMDGARIDFGEGAWAGIRQSNTSPRISICIETRSEKKLLEVKERILAFLKGYSVIDFTK